MIIDLHVVYCLHADTNECVSNFTECEEVCINTEGSFYCSCYNPGYRLDETGLNCTGIVTVMFWVLVSSAVNVLYYYHL